jgi:hypothetical protein
MEYNVLFREWNKRDKLIKEDTKVKEQLETIKEKRKNRKS